MELMAPVEWDQLATKEDLRKELQIVEYKLTARIERGNRRLFAALCAGLFACIVTLVGGMYAITQTIVNAL